MSTTSADRQRFQSSELSRSSAAVFAAAERGPVEVTRRDGESLVLMSATEAKAREQLFEIAAQMIAIATDEHGTLEERMADHFPWMYALGPADRVTCARDLVRAARAAFTTRHAHLAVAELSAWRSTASALAAGLGNGEIEWLEDEPEPVERP